MRNPARILAVLLTAAVLLVLGTYTYGRFFVAPYPGFALGAPDAEIYAVLADGDLQVGDRLVAVDGAPVAPLLDDRSRPLLQRRPAGTIVTLLIAREGELLTVAWVWPGRSLPLLIDRALNVWFLSYIFWIFGALTLLLIRPRDTRWWLLLGFYYVTALWMMMGDVSEFRLWNSSNFMRFFIWLSVPLYLHLHWVFPEPLRPLPRIVWPVVYAVGIAGGAAALLELTPNLAYFFTLLAAVGGSVLLIVLHYALQRGQRRPIGFLVFVALVGFVPLAVGLVVSALAAEPTPGLAGALFGLLGLPLAYFYLVYRRQAGWPELRANRYLSGFLLLSLMVALATVLMSLPVLTGRPDLLLGCSIATVILTTLLTLSGYRRFQRFLERRLWGIPSAPERVIDIVATRISASLDRETLATVLANEVMPSLLVTESALVTLTGAGDTRWLYVDGVGNPPASAEEVQHLVEAGPEGIFGVRSPRWVKLVLPLRLEEELLGLWLLGRHDPDDVFSEDELDLLRTLAAQTAVAVSNIQKTEQLLVLYAANIRRHEDERARLARYLHDDVLNALSTFVYLSQDPALQPQLEAAYDDLVESVRGTISDLRPAMLTYGLWSALDELTEWLRNRTAGGGQTIRFEVPRSGVRYRDEVENQLFRVVQQAAHNALQHGNANEIRITGELEPGKVDLVVGDDGMGFDNGSSQDLTHLLQEGHFGLVNMRERCTLIGAELAIESTPGGGTQVRVTYDRASNAARQAPFG